MEVKHVPVVPGKTYRPRTRTRSSSVRRHTSEVQRISDIVWSRADTVVWLDLARSRVIRLMVRRTLRRTTTRAELWNGNREPLSNLFRFKPEKSIMARARG
jgi:hypothetical protein